MSSMKQKAPGNSGGGETKAKKHLCIGAVFNGTLCSGSTAELDLFDDGISPVLTASVAFFPVSTIGILETIELDANGGTAGIAGIDNTFLGSASSTPEPYSGLLCAVGLFGIICCRRGFGQRG